MLGNCIDRIVFPWYFEQSLSCGHGAGNKDEEGDWKMGNHMVQMVTSGNHSDLTPRGMEELLKGFLNERVSGEYRFTATMGRNIKGGPNSKGVRVCRYQDHSVMIKAQPGDNGTCFEVWVQCPEGLKIRELYDAMKTELAIEGVVDDMAKMTAIQLEKKKGEKETVVLELMDEQQSKQDEVVASQERSRQISEEIRKLEIQLNEMRATRADADRMIATIGPQIQKIVARIVEAEDDIRRIDRRLEQLKAEEEAKKVLEQAAAAEAYLSTLPPEVQVALRQKGILR